MSTPVTDLASYSTLNSLTSPFKTSPTHHLRVLSQDASRCASLSVQHSTGSDRSVIFDYSRQHVTGEVMDGLFDLASEAGLQQKMRKMYEGEIVNETEGRSVLHHALRFPEEFECAGACEKARDDVHGVLGRVEAFVDNVRSGGHVGATGKRLTSVVAIGIGGSQLGPEFVNEALRCDKEASAAAEGRNLRFLANVDPVDVSRAFAGLDPER